jgi:hypothetical protein
VEKNHFERVRMNWKHGHHPAELVLFDSTGAEAWRVNAYQKSPQELREMLIAHGFKEKVSSEVGSADL